MNADGSSAPAMIYTDDQSFPRNRHYNDNIATALRAAAAEKLAKRDGGVHWLQPG